MYTSCGSITQGGGGATFCAQQEANSPAVMGAAEVYTSGQRICLLACAAADNVLL